MNYRSYHLSRANPPKIGARSNYSILPLVPQVLNEISMRHHNNLAIRQILDILTYELRTLGYQPLVVRILGPLLNQPVIVREPFVWKFNFLGIFFFEKFKGMTSIAGLLAHFL